MTTPESYVSVETVARRLCVSGETVRDWVRRGKLAAIRTPTGRIRIARSELRRRQRQWVAPETATVPICGVYFIKCGQFIKIGCTSDVTKRHQQVAAICPLAVKLAHTVKTDTIATARRLERAFHEQFKDSRHHHEWFTFSREIRAFISSHRGRA